jgi:hypothetical protein
MTTIAWLTHIYLTQSTQPTGALDPLLEESVLLPIDTLYVAVVGGVLLLGVILRELKRRYSEKRTFMGGPPRDRPDFSPSTLRYLRTFEVDATSVAAALVRLAAKGRISLRLVGDGIDVTRLENPPETELAPDEQIVFDTFLGDRDYMDLSNLWGELCSATFKALEAHYEEEYGRHYREPNKPFVYYVAFGFLGFLVALALTTKDPMGAIMGPPILGVCVWAIAFVVSQTTKDRRAAARYRPSFGRFVRSPSIGGARSLLGSARGIGMGVQQFFVTGFCFLFIMVFTFAMLSSMFGVEGGLIFLVMFFASAMSIMRLRDRRTAKGAELLAAIEYYAHGFDAAHAEDETGGWADALALDYLESVGDADDLSDEKQLRALNKQVPVWFSKSGGDAQAFELAQVLAERVPGAFEDAMKIYE